MTLIEQIAAAAAMAAPSQGAPLRLRVDGVAIEAASADRGARLHSVVLDTLPPDDALRRLMRQYLRTADTTQAVLCIEPDGRLALVARIEPGSDIPAALGGYCDAAVHWHRMARGLHQTRAPQGAARQEAGAPTMMIFP